MISRVSVFAAVAAAGRALQNLVAAPDASKASQRKKYEGTHAAKQALTKIGALAGNG